MAEPIFDRHPKWVRVEPGTVIPAGQPSRSERSDGYASEAPGSQSDWNVPKDGLSYFVDSSWKPPLVLPTEPTWGIAVNALTPRQRLGRWALRQDGEIFADHYDWWGPIPAEQVSDFIPLTDEQVQRIEAAR